MVRAAPTGLYQPGAGLPGRRGGGPSPLKRAGGALAGRIGVRPGAIGDARSKIGQGKIADARDLLGLKAKSSGMDARERLEKMRNLKEGNLEVKKIGGITRIKKVGGKIELSTKTKAGAGAPLPPSPNKTTQIGRLTKTVTSSGKVSLTSKSSQAKAGARPPGGPAMPPRSRSEGGGPGARAGGPGILRGAGGQKENRGGARDLEGLDQELMAMKVDPGLLHRTVETSRRQHVRRERSASPMERERSPLGGRRQGFADREGRRGREEDLPRAMEGRLEGVGTGVSPLQGTKVVIQNLQTSVTQEDIIELFGDIGALRRAKLVAPGHAEVTFINKADATRAVEIYHNRQLDGKPMKCTLTGADSVKQPGGATMALPKELQGGRERRGPAPDMDSIHRALFNKKSTPGKKQTFTITMPKKSKEEQSKW